MSKSLHDDTSAMFSQQDIEQLRQSSNILHLIYYRNKNQHRRAKWWKEFAMFRREVRRVLELSAPEGPEPELKGKGGFQRRKLWREENEMRKMLAKARVEFWKEARLIEGWYIAFTHLTTSTRFSTLGLVFLACLASVCRISNITQAFETEAQEELQALLTTFAKEEGEALFGEAGDRREGVIPNEDFGVSIAREDDAIPETNKARDSSARFAETASMSTQDMVDPLARSHMPGIFDNAPSAAEELDQIEGVASGHTATGLKTTNPPTHQAFPTPIVTKVVLQEPPKKKRKKGKANVIDDIFGGL